MPSLQSFTTRQPSHMKSKTMGSKVCNRKIIFQITVSWQDYRTPSYELPCCVIRLWRSSPKSRKSHYYLTVIWYYIFIGVTENGSRKLVGFGRSFLLLSLRVKHFWYQFRLVDMWVAYNETKQLLTSFGSRLARGLSIKLVPLITRRLPGLILPLYVSNWYRIWAIYRYVVNQAYYEPISDRKNLTVVVNAHVSEILSEYIVGAKINATGVKFISNDTTYETRLKKEVIISAG